jgi:hypothetical protein
MKHILILLLSVCLGGTILFAQDTIPANNSYIQYYGRWDMSDPTQPTHGWPGVYVTAVFQGTSIGVITDDNACWYNVIIDDTLTKKFHGTVYGKNAYTLVSGLKDTVHTILFTLRGETSWTKFGFYGFLLDHGKTLVAPPAKPTRKIEFIGDSYTSASGNEYTGTDAAPSDSLTNIYLGFGPIVARHFGAQYMMTSRGGIGLVLDWQGVYGDCMPNCYDRTLYYSTTPQWDYSQYVPNLVVVCLGLNDYSGWGGYSAQPSDQCAQYYRTKYHDFIATIMGVNTGAKILCVAPNGIEWLSTNIKQVVQEEQAAGHTNVLYGAFPYLNGTYVNSGHPSVTQHQQIADTLISIINTIDAWTPYVGTTKPYITEMPSSPATSYSSSYTLTVKTNVYATMKYSTADKSFDQMENAFTTTGTLLHSVVLSSVNGNSYTYYLRCKDSYGNVMDTSAVVTIVTDTTKTAVTWTSLSYDHSGWSKGSAPLGYGPSAATQTGKVITTYYKQSFNIDGAPSSVSCALYIKASDGAVIYLNGSQIGVVNMSANSGIEYSTLADKAYQFESTIPFSRASRPYHLLQTGMNVIAVEIHTANALNDTSIFDSYLYNSTSGTYFYPLGSEWYYYAGGSSPLNQAKTITVIKQEANLLPGKMDLLPNYPNPFNPSTMIPYQLSSRGMVTLKVYNILGKEVATLVNEQKLVGSYSVQWNAGKFASGVYFVTLRTANFMKTTKMLLLK